MISPVTFDSSASLPGSNHVRQVPSHLPDHFFEQHLLGHASHLGWSCLVEFVGTGQFNRFAASVRATEYTVS